MALISKNTEKLHNISRREINKSHRKGTQGWQVRRKKYGKSISKLFSDSIYGDKEKSLKAAIQYRDELEKLYPIEDKYKYLSKRNTSGIVGVKRISSSTKRPSGKIYTYDFWEARWPSGDGKEKTKKFSIHKYGEIESFKLALKTRARAILKITNSEEFLDEWGSQTVQELLNSTETAKNPQEKGTFLEELVFRLFNSTKSFKVNSLRRNTQTEEIDLVILNNSDDPRFRKESAILLVECKNWTKKCGKNEFVIFKEKIENRSNRCSLGFLISWNGFAETVNREMLRGSREETLVIPIDGESIKRAIESGDLLKVLSESWDHAVML